MRPQTIEGLERMAARLEKGEKWEWDPKLKGAGFPYFDQWSRREIVAGPRLALDRLPDEE